MEHWAQMGSEVTFNKKSAKIKRNLLRKFAIV